MAKVWRCHVPTEGESPVCLDCKKLNGRREGDGWHFLLGINVDRFKRDENGEWVDTRPGELAGAPPLHPNCRCWVEEVFPAEAAEAIAAASVEGSFVSEISMP